MLRGNLKRAFDRLFLVLATAWMLYWVVVYPVRLRSQWLDSAYMDHLRAEDQCKAEEAQARWGGRTTDTDACLKSAQVDLERGVNDASLGKIYGGDWQSILIIGVIYPPVVYGLLYISFRAVRAVCLWIWRGYREPKVRGANDGRRLPSGWCPTVLWMLGFLAAITSRKVRQNLSRSAGVESHLTSRKARR